MHRTAQRNLKWFVILGVTLFALALLAIFMRNMQLDTPRLPLGQGVETAMDWAIIYLSPALEAMKISVGRVFVAVESAFLWLPWPVWVLLVGALGWSLASWRTGLLVSISLSVVQGVGLWNEAMSTLSLISVAVILALIIAIPIGVIAARSNLFEGIIRPVLDAMQTIPSMVYLIPVVMLLGVGKVPAILATMVFGIPPAIRLTNLGLRQVSAETKEAAISFGASKWQLLTKVELPLAARTIMAGVNQSTMMSVSMVIIAAFIGAGGLGYSVLFALNRVKVGTGFEAGLAILLIAIVLDRLTQALSKASQPVMKRSE
jgi:glycine betaine/proline transport system permease protein